MKRALSMIRSGLHYRREIFHKGLEAHGYAVQYHSFEPEEGDCLIIWNRYGHFDQMARKFEKRGGTVFVVENGYLGKDYNGGDWYALSQSHHNGAGFIPDRSYPRFSIRYNEPRKGSKDFVLLPQRGIGEVGVAMPRDWLSRDRRWFPDDCRVRRHAGKVETSPLLEDLQDTKGVITWGSGAAVKAIVAGIPCVHFFPRWIGAEGSTFYKDVDDWDNLPLINPEPMLKTLSWAMWSGDEIRSGEAFSHFFDE